MLCRLLPGTALKIGAALSVLAILDYAYRRIRHERDLRMSPEEMRAELRNLQGDPRTTARRRGLWRQMASGVGKTSIAAEDVVITGDQGTAVVVRYNARTMPAPVVIAKGTGRQGARLVALAAERHATTMHREPLAKALDEGADADRPIPQSLYFEVAAVLAQAAKPGRGIIDRSYEAVPALTSAGS